MEKGPTTIEEEAKEDANERREISNPERNKQKQA